MLREQRYSTLRNYDISTEVFEEGDLGRLEEILRRDGWNPSAVAR